jgi:hypothetical protein
MGASCRHAQKFIVPCPAIALQREVIPAAGIVEIARGSVLKLGRTVLKRAAIGWFSC